MLARIKEMMFGTGGGDAAGADASENIVAAAAAALMIEAAVMDGNFDDDERRTIADLLGGRFEMNADEVNTVIAEAETAVEQSVELFAFTRVLRDDFDHGDRVGMIEMLWEVAYADGVLHDYEANLIRRVTGLLHVTDRESGDAKKRVLERLDIGGGAA